jgi:cytochrome bd ubiquinol oxidase subunit I
MTELLAARLAMAFSLGFHIIFAAIGMTIPFFMIIAYWRYLKYKDPLDLHLTKIWSYGTAILFATGAVSGTVLSFELGLLWPKFMKFAGPIIGMPFSWEGLAFFLEAIAIGLFLYGWDRMHPWIHWTSGLIVGISGFISGIFVVSANSWMNSPSGFELSGSKVLSVDPVAAMFNDAWFHQALHMQLAALSAVGFAVAGIHSFLLIKGKKIELHKRAINIAMFIGGIAALIIPISGHFSAQWVAKKQPAKLAAMEAHYETLPNAPILLGGIADEKTGTIKYGIKIPYLLSILAFNDPHAIVKGLNEFKEDERPPVNITHISFQIMVAIGTLMALMSILYFYFKIQRKNLPLWLLKAFILFSPMGFIAIEAGWIVTEVGRQPWIIYNFMKTKDALTSVSGLAVHFYLFLFLYLILGLTCFWLLKRVILHTEKIV